MQHRLIDTRWLRISASLVLALLFLFAGALFMLHSFSGFAWDFSINWTGAWALREGVPLYDQTAMQALAIRHIDSGMHTLFNGPFQSYISPPTTAMLMLPLTPLAYDQAELLYRSISLLALLAGVALTALSTPTTMRRHAMMVGCIMLALWQPAQMSIKLGQLDSFVVLALGAAFFGVARGQWKLAGIAMGIATLLKISPGLLVVYCLLKRQWTVVIAASCVLLAGSTLCWLPHNGGDIKQFFTQIVPVLADGTAHLQNQSLGAFLTRLASGNTRQWAFSFPLGVWQYTSLAAVGVLMLALFWQQKARQLHLDELACLTLLALLGGSISWDHYFTWAILPSMLLATRFWSGWLLAMPFFFTPTWTVGHYTAASLLMVALLLFIQRFKCLR